MTQFNVLVGCDPELFVKKNDMFVSGYGLIEGTKANPHKVNKGAVQVDGHALEFNIDPADDEDSFVENINTVVEQLRQMVPEHQLVAQPVATFTKEYLKSMPDEANELGCDPDFCAWNNGEPNPRPDGDVDFRTGGGHVHVGWTNGVDITDEEHAEAGLMLTKELDYYLGLASLFWDNDDQRRAMYGKAGAYRVKHFGVEYRSLSNAWLKDEKLIRFVDKATRLAADNLAQGHSIAASYGNCAQRAIDRNDRSLAKDIIEVVLEGEFGLAGWFESIPCKVEEV